MEYQIVKKAAILNPSKESFLRSRYRDLSSVELSFLEKVDPTQHGDFAEWLLKNLRLRTILLDDAEKTSTLLGKFIKLKNSPKFKERHSTDINSYTPGELWKCIDEGELSRKEKYRIKDVDAQEFHFESFTIYKVETAKDASILSQGTNWCTANNPTLAEEYLREAPLWVVFRDTKQYAQIHGPTKQFMDASDIPRFFTLEEVTGENEYASQEDLDLLEEISKKDPTVRKGILNHLKLKRAPGPEDFKKLFKNFSSKEFFLFIKLFDISKRFPNDEEETLFTKLVYPADRETYLELFSAPDPTVTSFLKEGFALPTWIYDYYTFVMKSPVPESVKANEKEYSYLLHKAYQGDYQPILSKKRISEMEFQVLNKIMDARVLHVANPEFETCLERLLESDSESPEYIRLAARYAIGFKKGSWEVLNEAIEAQYIADIPVARYIRKYWPEYLLTEKGSTYIFTLMQLSQTRDEVLEDQLPYQTSILEDDKAKAKIIIHYLTRFKIKRDDLVGELLNLVTTQDYVKYSENTRVAKFILEHRTAKS